MNTQIPAWRVALLLVAAFLAFGGPSLDGCHLPIGGGSAQFTLPDGVPVAGIVVYDATPAALEALTSDQATITTGTGDGSARKAIEDAGGKFRLISSPPGEYEEQWVRDAYQKKGNAVPWLVASGKRGGMNQQVPPTVRGADVVSRLKVISGK